jgi:small subunit ribosomal protein S18
LAGRGGQRSSGRRRSSSSRRWFGRGRKKKCVFCEEKVDYVGYKDVGVLERFLTDRGKIRPRRRTGTCAKHQRQLSIAIKRARHLALLPFVVESRPNR